MSKFIILLFIGFLSFSCVPHKKLLYLKPVENNPTYSSDSLFNYRVQPGDILDIEISSTVASQLEIFNKKFENEEKDQKPAGYVIDSKGSIELPLVGKIFINNFTLEEIDSTVKARLNEYIDYSFVKTRILNFQISVLGEVRLPGTMNINAEQINIFQALGKAGDMTDFSNRKRVKLIRKNGNSTKVVTLDLSNSNIIESKYYYLSPNDIIYVEPLKIKTLRINSGTLSLIISSLSIIVIILRYSR